ncbi:MAG: hypothetical protein C4297_00985 [Gemmataceae bacterium]
MAHMRVHSGIIRPSLLETVRSHHNDRGSALSVYVDIDMHRWGGADAARIAAKTFFSEERERLHRADIGRTDREIFEEELQQAAQLALEQVGERRTSGLAIFLDSQARLAWAFRLPWPVRNRAFYGPRFVLWPLQQQLALSPRLGLILTDKDDARLFLYHLGELEECLRVEEEIPGKIRFPEPLGELQYMRKHVEAFRHHFARVADEALALYEKEHFEKVILGGLWETLPQFEARLHRYVRDRVIARWDIAVHTPLDQLAERVRREESNYLASLAAEAWKLIQDRRQQRGAVGPEQTFAALWRQSVQTVLLEPGVGYGGYRCTRCRRLHLSSGPCIECGGAMAPVHNILLEAVQDAVEQGAEVFYWKNSELNDADSIAALRRF